MPPGANAQPIIVHISLIPPFEGSFKISGSIGLGGSKKYEFIVENTAESIEEQYNLFVQKAASGSF